MGFLGRAVRAATELRAGLDLAAGRAGSAIAEASPPPADADRRAVDRARALGSPDPWALVTADEARTALGAPAGPPRLTYGDDSIGVIRAAVTGDGGSGAVSVSAFHAADADAAPWDPAEHWHGFLAPLVEDDATAVGGIGRAALRTERGLYVLGGSALLYLELRRPDGGTADAPIGALARAVLGRVDRTA